MARVFIFVLAVLAAAAVEVSAQQPVFVVRHAERADAGAGGTMMAADPELSDTGRARAQALAATLRDAGITAIFVSEYKRTQQTAEPLATKLGLQPTVVTAKDPAALIEKINAATGPVLVIGHSNTVPEILGKLGVENPPKLGDQDYDDLFVFRRGENPLLLRLHYR